MILLDTNVVSELMRPVPSARVVNWLDAQDADTVWVSAITLAEIRLGVALLPKGKRQDLLSHLADTVFEEEFRHSCLPFDAAAASHYATIVASRTRRGRPISVEDAQIAAIARSVGLKLATRNVDDFLGIDRLMLVNPWNGEVAR